MNGIGVLGCLLFMLGGLGLFGFVINAGQWQSFQRWWSNVLFVIVCLIFLLVGFVLISRSVDNALKHSTPGEEEK